MRHHAFTAAMGVLLAATLLPGSMAQAASGDPTGIWRKAQQGERPGKIEVFRCGAGNRYICAKIVWLQDPLDSQGRPLHDIRNENPGMRDRPILGLRIINGMAPVAPNQWKGNIYNPEDGNTYSATLTLVSRNQINLKGCKAWLLCGERTWLRTSAPPKATPEPDQQIEAKAEPKAEPEAQVQQASATPEAAPAKPEPKQENVLANADVLTPVSNTSADSAGYRFLDASSAEAKPAGYNGESVPSMFAMTKPLAGEEEAAATPSAAPRETASAEPNPAPIPATPKPKPHTIQASVAPSPAPTQPTRSYTEPGTAPSADAEALPADGEAVGDETVAPSETAELEAPMTRRERRLLRRKLNKEKGLLPWLR